MRTAFAFTATAAMLLGASQPSFATKIFNTDVTPDVIFGGGNANGAWTVDQTDGVELGLRAKVRFDSSNQPQNVFNYVGQNGNQGVYKFDSGLPPTGFGFASGSPSTATWNFEWAINSSYDGTGGVLDTLTYELGIDFDPGPGTNFLTFDPIDQTCADHALGDNTTGNGGGTSYNSCPGDAGAYQTAISTLNVAQNSWNMEFFDDAGGGFAFNGAAPGVYDFYLTASNSSGEIARTEISVHVPEPATLALLAMGLAGVGVSRRRSLA